MSAQGVAGFGAQEGRCPLVRSPGWWEIWPGIIVLFTMPKTVDINVIEQNARAAARLLRVAAHKKRLLVLAQPYRGERCVGELVKALGTSQSTMSQHLMLLREHKLVTARRKRTKTLYSLAPHSAVDILRMISTIVKS
jgi:DNA-binding transcriptional ArsR family regulator